MKCRCFFILFFAILFQGSFLENSLAMDKEERRLKIYSSPEEYLASFKEHGTNHGKLKILYIGAGLTYDDLVIKSDNHFAKELKTEKTRLKYYPLNAFLIDLDGKFFYAKHLLSHSDLQASIGKGMGKEKSLPTAFTDQFDCIVLENLDYSAMTGKAFQNLFSLLKVGGKIICNIDFEIKIMDMGKLGELRKNREEFAILDTHNNALIELYYPHSWAERKESLLEEYTFIISPIHSKEDNSYIQLSKHHHDKVINIISFHDFEQLYTKNHEYKTSLFHEIKGVYEFNLTEYFKTLIPKAHLSFTDSEELWCAPPNTFGFFVITKK